MPTLGLSAKERVSKEPEVIKVELGTQASAFDSADEKHAEARASQRLYLFFALLFVCRGNRAVPLSCTRE
jgi:hypothetical protein